MLPIAIGVLFCATVIHGLTSLVSAIIATTRASSGQWRSHPEIIAIPFTRSV